MAIDTSWFENGVQMFAGSISDLIDNFKEGIDYIGDTFFGGSHSTNEANMSMNQENIAFQKEENEITRLREDNAVQRAAADMTAAGLSKTLAAGHPASAQSLQAPSNTFEAQKNSAGLNMMNMIKNLFFESEANDRANKLNNAQVDLVNAQAGAQNFANSVQEQTWENEQEYKKAITAQANSNTELNKSNKVIADITGDNLQKEIDSKIALNVANTVESYSRTALNNVNRRKADKEIHKISMEIYTEYLNQGLIKAKTDTEKEQLKLAIASATKCYYDTEILKHNLNYAQKNGLPVGVVPNGLAGSIYNTGTAMLNWMSNYINSHYKGGAKSVFVPSFGFDGSVSMQEMPYGGGGHAW